MLTDCLVRNTKGCLFNITLLAYLLAMLGLCCCMGLSLVVVSGGGYSLVAVHRLLISMASLVAEHVALLGGRAVVVAGQGSSSCSF